jgi:Putative transposase
MSGIIATRSAQKTRVCNSKMKVWWRWGGAWAVTNPAPRIAIPKPVAPPMPCPPYHETAEAAGIEKRTAEATLANRRRPQAFGRMHRHHRGAPHLGSALTHHPHVHMIVPGGGLSAKLTAAQLQSLVSSADDRVT